MNKRKIIKYILIAVPVLFLAKWHIETAYYNSNKTPEINPNPKEKLRIYGKFPFEQDEKLDFIVTYVNNNRKCDDTNWLPGIQFPQRRKIAFPATVKNGTFNSIVYLDSFVRGACDYRASYVGLSFKYAATQINFIKFVNKNIPKHEVLVNCSELKSENKPYTCEVEMNQYFVLRVDLDDMKESESLRHDMSDYNEISNSQKDIEVNIKLKGKK